MWDDWLACSYLTFGVFISRNLDSRPKDGNYGNNTLKVKDVGKGPLHSFIVTIVETIARVVNS